MNQGLSINASSTRVLLTIGGIRHHLWMADGLSGRPRRGAAGSDTETGRPESVDAVLATIASTV